MTDVLTWQRGVVFQPAALTAADIRAIRDALSPTQAVALTMWAEARSRLEPGKGWVSNPIDAMTDVCNVIDNRVTDRRWSTRGHKGVCFQRWAFSCWEPTGGHDDPHDADLLAENFESLIARAQLLLGGLTPSTKLQACLDVAQSFIDKRHPDLLPLATHYHATWIDPPRWAVPPAECVMERYGHRFFRFVK